MLQFIIIKLALSYKILKYQNGSGHFILYMFATQEIPLTKYCTNK